MKQEGKKTVRTSENFHLTIPGTELRKIISQELAAQGAERLPDDAYIFVSVPGGGDWSNTELDLSVDAILEIRWTSVTESEL